MQQIPPVNTQTAIFAQFPELVVGLSGRTGGVSPEPLGMNLSFSVGDDEPNVIRNRELFFGSLGLQMNQMAVQGQVHGTTVRVVTRAGRYEETDGLITQTPGLILTVSIADCQPVLLYDPVSHAVAGIHSGWRGTEGRILERAISIMREQCAVRPENIVAWLGPAARGCCYEVGEEVAAKFNERFLTRAPGKKTRLDIANANYEMLLGLGLKQPNIALDDRCTIHNPADFHSYRRDGARSGRMMAVIGLRS